MEIKVDKSFPFPQYVFSKAIYEQTPSQCKKEDVVAIDIREGMDVVEVSLKANSYTDAKEDMRVFAVKLQSPQACKYTAWKMVTDFIDNLKEFKHDSTK